MLYDSLEDCYVQTSLGRMHYKLHAGKPAIVFLHGFGASTLSYKKLVEQLPDDVGACLIDLLGHGESDAPRIEYTIGRQAQAVKEVTQSLSLQDSYLFGNSYGGWIAASIAQGNYKGRGIILEDAMGLKEIFDDIEKQGNVEEWKRNWMAKALVFNPKDWVIRSAVNDQPTGEFLTKESLSGIVKPCLILWGENDRTLDVKYAKLFSEYIKGSVLEIIQGAEHVAHYTHANEVSHQLLKFIGMI